MKQPEKVKWKEKKSPSTSPFLLPYQLIPVLGQKSTIILKHPDILIARKLAQTTRVYTKKNQEAILYYIQNPPSQKNGHLNFKTLASEYLYP